MDVNLRLDLLGPEHQPRRKRRGLKQVGCKSGAKKGWAKLRVCYMFVGIRSISLYGAKVRPVHHCMNPLLFGVPLTSLSWALVQQVTQYTNLLSTSVSAQVGAGHSVTFCVATFLRPRQPGQKFDLSPTTPFAFDIAHTERVRLVAQ